ncbi:hypothetical protein [Deinococcus alpinitundrae]|uniref:hypothetical protein n=1 Tax=Deinococcus alpinitundrae TaxID=468913 RepID=UPI001379FACA|nr:hypothetical protein [Deinococcus alpinitundrae]
MSTPPTDQVLTAERVQHFARLSGLELNSERAAQVALALVPMLAGDARLAALNLGTLSPLGPTWPETARE